MTAAKIADNTTPTIQGLANNCAKPIKIRLLLSLKWQFVQDALSYRQAQNNRPPPPARHKIIQVITILAGIMQ